jgi:aryl-alcohol dehydrogenase-like predicted oxidoreductase
MGGQKVSVIGLGTWQFGSNGWGWGTEYGPKEAREVIGRALALGVNFMDTAEMYGGGQSEQVLGEALAGRRHEAFIATKVSPHHLLRASVVRAATRSLRRLATDAVDLYQVHWPVAVVPHSWTMSGMRELQANGHIRHVGVSNYSLQRWQGAQRALGGPIISNQVRYHLLDRSAEQALVPYAQASGRFIIAYSPLAQGLLSGRYTPDHLPGGVRLASTLFTPSNVRKAKEVIGTLQEVGKAHGATAAQVALAWLVHHPNVLAIPGAKSAAQVEANAAAADIQLSEAEFNAITEASDSFRPASGVTSLRQLVHRTLLR